MEILGLILAIVGIAFAFETPRRWFLRLLRHPSGAERVQGIPTATAPSSDEPSELTIDIEPTATERGQQPKLLVRIVDPHGDYRTQWSVTLKSPSGVEYSAAASWPGSGKVFRVRFATTEPRTGKWIGVAVRNGDQRHEFAKVLPYPDAA